MFAARVALAILVLGSSIGAEGNQTSTAPSYSSASIVNSASNLPNDYAPNTIVSIYGVNLASGTQSLPANSSKLPTTLGGVTVYMGIGAASLFYVSPTQINILVPNTLLPGPVAISVVRQGSSGPAATIVLGETAPGLFQSNPGTLLATHADGSLITAASPASAGEVIVIYAVGLGRTIPDSSAGQVAYAAAPIQHLADLRVLVNGNAIDPRLIYYAGLTPGFAGLYQINVQLPGEVPGNPEVRVAIGSQMSAAGLSLPTH
ncbi:MAG: hypothetical protein JWO80_3347 [Bryobacterales bacterium]|nr:hypothetical protein [Bryobacterales bacterium]